MNVTLTEPTSALMAIHRTGGIYQAFGPAPTEDEVRAFVGFLRADTKRIGSAYIAPLWAVGESGSFPNLQHDAEYFLMPTGPSLYADLGTGIVTRSLGRAGRYGLTLEPQGPVFVAGATLSGVVVASPLRGEGTAESPLDVSVNPIVVSDTPYTLEAWDAATCTTGASAILLPLSPAAGDECSVFAGVEVTIDANGNQFTDGSGSYAMSLNEHVTVLWNGSNWLLK